MSIISPAARRRFIARAYLPNRPARSRSRSTAMADTLLLPPVPVPRTAPRAALCR
jgi:hypothetical protein